MKKGEEVSQKENQSERKNNNIPYRQGITSNHYDAELKINRNL